MAQIHKGGLNFRKFTVVIFSLLEGDLPTFEASLSSVYMLPETGTGI